MSSRQFDSVEKHTDVSHYRQHKWNYYEEKHQELHEHFNPRIRIVDDLTDTGREKRNELDLNTVKKADNYDGLREDPRENSEDICVTRREGVGSESLFDREDPMTRDEADKEDFRGREGVAEVGDQPAQSFTCRRVVGLYFVSLFVLFVWYILALQYCIGLIY